MNLQATFTLADLADAVRSFVPLEIRLGDLGGTERLLVLESPEKVVLVPGRGLRIETTARITWTIAGLSVPFTVQAAQILLLPEIEQREGRDRLRFLLVLEGADLKNVPSFLDAKVVEQVNLALQEEDARPTWDFLDTLSFSVDLPDRLRSARALELSARRGTVKITEEALVFTVSYEAAVKKDEVVTLEAVKAEAAA